MITPIDNQAPEVVRVLHEMTVIMFEHLGITKCKVIDQMWVFIDQVLKGLAWTKLGNAIITWKDIERDEYVYHWGLGEPDGLCSEYLWALWKTYGIRRNSGDIADKDRWIYLDQDLWFMMGRLIWNKYHNVSK